MDDDPLSGFGLRPVTLTDQARFDACFQSLVEPLSDYTFSQLFTWGNSLRILWKEIRGHMCVFANGTGDLTLLMPPIGEGGSDRALSEVFEIMNAYNAAHGVCERSRVEYASEELVGRLNRSGLVLVPMGADYVYDVNRMIELGGGDLASKRQLKNRFLRNYQWRVEEYDRRRHMGSCLGLLHLWKKQQDAHHNVERLTSAVKRHQEAVACEMALEHADRLRYKGLVVYVRPEGEADGWSLRGFTFGEALGSDQSSIIIEKTDLGVRGLAQFIFSEFCRRCWAERPLVNAGDDWGLETLAWTKMSYRPVKLLQKYEFRLAPRVAVRMPVGGREGAGRGDGQLLLFPEMPDPAPTANESGETTVRRARKSDVTEAVRLEQSCFNVHCFTKRRLQYLQQSPSAVFLVAEHGGRIVGQGISLVRRHKRELSGRIYSLAVKDEHRRQKLGQRLLRGMIDDLAARGVKRVYLEVEQSNTAAVGLYERNGFRSVGVLRDYYGQGRPGLHMRCAIRAAGDAKETAEETGA
jgi:ribosomal-protein-alanine acetyltransferase